MIRFRITWLLVAFILFSTVVQAGLNEGVETTSSAELLPWAVFDGDIPSPDDITGIAMAERPLRTDEILHYYRVLAKQSPRARLIEYARSHEGRPLVLLAVGNEAVIADLDALRERRTALMTDGVVPTPKDKAVAWMAYGIHGDELSSTDAAAILAHWLVAGEDEHARRIRATTLVLIDPCENPDGRARYLAQTTAFAHRTANPGLDDLSHTSVWPWGRGNHYLFDLNRDWMTQIHPESVRSSVIAQWQPDLLVDSHEMNATSTYLFPPARHPYNPHQPKNVQEWELRFSGDQAAALDQRGYPYFSGEWNEEFFPGYGSSWATYHGTIGILYEMSRTTGTLVRKPAGTVRTFAQAIDHQVTSSVANLVTLATNATSMVSNHAASRQAAAADGADGSVRAWILPADPLHPGRLDDFAAHLEGLGIAVHQLNGETRTRDLIDIRTGEKTSPTLDAGALMIRLDQPSAPMIHVLLDPHVPMETKFLQEEREYREKRKGGRLYEVTAWSLLLMRGLDAHWTGRIPGGDWARWTESTPESITPLGDSYLNVVIDGDADSTPAALADLLQRGVVVRVAEKPMTVDGRAFRRGALLIRREENADDLTSTLNEVALTHGTVLTPTHSSRTDNGGPDLGGRLVDPLVAPRVGVLTGAPVSPTAYGSVWHMLDQELNLRFSGLDISRFSRVDLSRFNVLVFPAINGSPGMYRDLIGLAGIEALRNWIAGGGTAIGLGTGAKMLASEGMSVVETSFRGQVVDRHPSPVWSLTAAEVRDIAQPSATGILLDETGAALIGNGRYDIAPILGPGALPFAKGYDQGRPLTTKPVPLVNWLKPTPKTTTPEELLMAHQEVDARLRSFMPRGAMLRVDLHDESWLTYGLDETASILFRADDCLIAEPPATTIARFPEIDRMHLGGLLWPEAAARMSGTAYAVREAVGRGQVILFAASPTFRRWMTESERMFTNAVLMGPGLGTRWTAAW